MKILTKLSLFALCAFLLFSCSNDDFDDVDVEDKSSNSSLNHVTTNEVRQFVKKLSPEIFNYGNEKSLRTSGTKAERRISEILPIIQNSDTVIQIVNYLDNKGFVIISTDRSASTPVLAFSNKGYFDLNNLNDPLVAWLDEQSDDIQNNKKQIDEKDKINTIWDNILKEDNKIQLYPQDGKLIMSDNLRYSNNIEITKPEGGRLTQIHTKWDQNSPYNLSCPWVVDANSGNRVQAKVGCV